MIKSFKQCNFTSELFTKIADLMSIFTEISLFKTMKIYILEDENNYRLFQPESSLPEVIAMADIEVLEITCSLKRVYFQEALIAIILYGYSEEQKALWDGMTINKQVEKIEGFILKASQDIYNKIQGEIHLTLMHLLRGLNSQFNREESIELVLRFIKEELSLEAVFLQVNEEKRIFIPQYATEIKKLSMAGATVPTQKSIRFYKQTRYICDSETIKAHFPRFEKILEIKALISMPIYQHGRLTGLLVVYHSKNDRIDEGIQYIVNKIADELTVLFTRIDRQNLNLEKMLSLSALETLLLSPVEENVNIDEFLEKLLSVLPTVTGMKNCTIAPLDEKSSELLIKYTTHYKIKSMNRQQVPISQEKISQQTVMSKKPVIIYDALTDPRCDNLLMSELGIYSYIALPISNIYGKILGILFLDNGEYHIFTKEQVRFFEVIARHIGLMISNAVYIEELFIKSRFDGLTGLYNRETFEVLYTKLYDNYRYEDKCFSVLMLDIDDFKEVNDQFGHQVGDEILKRVADCIMKSVRKEDIVGRYGGEEIIILLKDSDSEGAKAIAERIRSSVELVVVEGVRVTVSIGISTFRTDSHDRVKLISIADACLYEAKKAGKNFVKSLH